jgi:hypothetical protein
MIFDKQEIIVSATSDNCRGSLGQSGDTIKAIEKNQA